MNARAVGFALIAALGLVVALALGPPDVVRAAPTAGCITGLPADLATQLQPLIQALAEANGDVPNCDPNQSGASGLDPVSRQHKDLELLAEAPALLAMADPGYGYPSAGYGYPSAGYGHPPASYGYPTAGLGSTAACGPP